MNSGNITSGVGKVYGNPIAAVAIRAKVVYNIWMEGDGWEQISTVRLILASVVAVAHITIALFIFFLTCQHNPPSALTLTVLMAVALLVVVGASIASGILFEERKWIARFFVSTQPV